MSFVTRFRKAFERFIETRSGNTLEVPGLLGNSSLVVPTGVGANVYVTLWDGSVIEVVNRRVSNKAGTHVVVGIDPAEPGVLQVLRRRGVFGEDDKTIDLANHADSHQYPNYDWIPLRQEQFLPLLVLPDGEGGFVVRVYAATVQKSDGSGWFRVGNQTIDLTSHKPTAGARYVRIESDDAGTLSVIDGSLVSAKELLTLSHIPAGTGLPIVAVRLYDGQEEIRRDNVIDDFIDLRAALLSLGKYMLASDYDSDGDGAVDMAEGLKETGGPTEMALGAVADGKYLKRSGSAIVGGDPGDMSKATYDADDDGAVDMAEGLKEISGPTELALGSVADGQYLKRSGSSIVGDTPAGSGDMTKAVYDTNDDGSVNEADIATIAQGLEETGGPTDLAMGAVADGQYLKRSGSSIVGDSGTGGSGSLTVEEADGSPSVGSVDKIRVRGGTVTDEGSGDVLLDILGGIAMQNEIMNFPPLENADGAQPEWWEKSADCTLTNEDVAGESLTAKYSLRCFKVVTTSNNKYAYQRMTYADQPRVKAGEKLSVMVAVWSVASAAARIRLITSASTAVVSSSTTAASWTVLRAEGIALDGTYVDIQLEVDSGTAYFIPLGCNVGQYAIRLRNRGLRYVYREPISVLSLTDVATGSTGTIDLTANTSNITVMALVSHWASDWTGDGWNVSVRRGGGTNYGLILQPENGSYRAQSQINILLDDGQAYGWSVGRWAGGGALNELYAQLQGYWEWE